MATVYQALRRWWPLAAVAALLAAAALTAAHSAPQIDRTRTGGPDGPPLSPEAPETFAVPSPVPEQPREGGVPLPGWIDTLVTVVAALLAAAVVALILWFLLNRFLRGRAGGQDGAQTSGGRPGEEQHEEVIAAVDAGLADLSDLDRDPRRAVIACWLRLEEAAEAAGLPPRVGDTSTDLVIRLLSGAGPAGQPGPAGAGGEGPAGAGGEGPAVRVVSADVLAGFAQVYRAARYATHEVDEGMREQAGAALRRLRAELTAPVAP